MPGPIHLQLLSRRRDGCQIPRHSRGESREPRPRELSQPHTLVLRSFPSTPFINTHSNIPHQSIITTNFTTARSPKQAGTSSVDRALASYLRTYTPAPRAFPCCLISSSISQIEPTKLSIVSSNFGQYFTSPSSTIFPSHPQGTYEPLLFQQTPLTHLLRQVNGS